MKLKLSRIGVGTDLLGEVRPLTVDHADIWDSSTTQWGTSAGSFCRDGTHLSGYRYNEYPYKHATFLGGLTV